MKSFLGFLTTIVFSVVPVFLFLWFLGFLFYLLKLSLLSIGFARENVEGAVGLLAVAVLAYLFVGFVCLVGNKLALDYESCPGYRREILKRKLGGDWWPYTIFVMWLSLIHI